jgi:hypothetical protein
MLMCFFFPGLGIVGMNDVASALFIIHMFGLQTSGSPSTCTLVFLSARSHMIPLALLISMLVHDFSTRRFFLGAFQALVLSYI